MSRNTDDFIKAFKAARRTSTPLLVVRTPDSVSATELIMSTFGANADSLPGSTLGVMRSMIGLTRPGKEEAARVLDGGDPAMVAVRPSEALALAGKLAEESIRFFSNAQRFHADPVAMQAVWNLRDRLSSSVGCVERTLNTNSISCSGFM